MFEKKLTDNNDIIDAVLEAFQYEPHYYHSSKTKISNMRFEELTGKPREGQKSLLTEKNSIGEYKKKPPTHEELAYLKYEMAKKFREQLEDLRKKDIAPAELNKEINKLITSREELSATIRLHVKFIPGSTTYISHDNQQTNGGHGDDQYAEVIVTEGRWSDPKTSHVDSKFEKYLKKAFAVVEKSNRHIKAEENEAQSKLTAADNYLEGNNRKKQNFAHAAECYGVAQRLAVKHGLEDIKNNSAAGLKNILDDSEKFTKLTKEQLFDAIKRLPTEDQRNYLKKCLDKNEPLGQKFWQKRGIMSPSLEKGTLNMICKHLQDHLGEKGKKIVEEAKALPSTNKQKRASAHHTEESHLNRELGGRPRKRI